MKQKSLIKTTERLVVISSIHSNETKSKFETKFWSRHLMKWISANISNISFIFTERRWNVEWNIAHGRKCDNFLFFLVAFFFILRDYGSMWYWDLMTELSQVKFIKIGEDRLDFIYKFNLCKDNDNPFSITLTSYTIETSGRIQIERLLLSIYQCLSNFAVIDFC